MTSLKNHQLMMFEENLRKAPVPPSCSLRVREDRHRGGGSSHHFPEIAGVHQRKKEHPHLPQHLTKSGRSRRSVVLPESAAGDRGGSRSLTQGRRCGPKSGSVGVKAAHTPAALPDIYQQAAAAAGAVRKPDRGHVTSFNGRVNKDMVSSQGLESHTPARHSQKAEASQHQRDQEGHKSLLIRRATLHEVESRAVCSAPPRPSQLVLLSQRPVPLVCQSQGKPGEVHPKCEGASLKLITLGGPNPIPLQTAAFKVLRKPQSQGKPQAGEIHPKCEGASSLKLIMLGGPNPVPLHSAAFKVRNPQRQGKPQVPRYRSP